MFGKIDLSNPAVLISILIGISIGVQMVVSTFPSIVTALVSLASLDNFSFTSFFGGSGIVYLILSALVLYGVFSLLGINLKSGSKR